MFKSSGISRKQTGVIITLLVIVFLGASYFFIYIPNNERTVQERHFRCLQNVDVNIHNKIQNNFRLVENLFRTYSAKNDTNLKDHINVFNKQIDTFYNLKPDFIVLADATPGLFNDSLTLLSVAHVLNRKHVENTLHGHSAKSHVDTAKIYVRFGAGQFIKPLLPSGVFDNYIVFYKKAKQYEKLYETFPSGLSGNIDSLLETKNKVTGPGIRSLTIGGTDYKVFSQPVTTMNGDTWLIAGLVSSKNYQQEKNQLPLWIILLLLTAAIGIIVSIPWIKLYHMGNKDKLTVTDGIATILVAMVLMSLLFFVLFKYNFSTLQLVKTVYPSAKDTLADKITCAFENELKESYLLLDTCDKVYAHADSNRKDILNFGRGSQHDDLLKVNKLPIAVHQVYWLNNAGKEKINWVSDVNIPKGTDLHERDYFKNIIQGKPNRKGKYPFYLDQNVSWVTGAFTSVMAKKSAHPGDVAALGFSVKSLDSVIMPDGYQFAIIDANGNVLYHYHADLNLKENLKIEFADSSSLVSCLEARSDTDFKAEYFGKQYNIRIRPLADLPYFTVVFEDLEYNNTRDMEAYVFTLSMLILLLIFLIIEFSIVFFTSSKRSFFKKQIFDTSWVGPKITSHGQYNMAIIANIVIIVLLTLYFEPNSFLIYLYIVLFSIVFVSIFLNSIFAKSYKKDNRYLYHFKIVAIVFLCLFEVVIDFAACMKLTPAHILKLFSYEVILIIVCGALFFTGSDLMEKARGYKRFLPFRWTYTHSFSMMATTRLVITCGIPVAFFFVYSFNYEQKLDTRYRQLKFVKQFNQKIQLAGAIGNDSTHVKADSIKVDSIERNLVYTSGIYNDCLFVDSIKITSKQKIKPKITSKEKEDSTYSPEDSLTAQILGAFRFHIYNVEIKNNNMNLPAIDDSTTFSRMEHDQDLIIDENHKQGHRHFTHTTFKLNHGEYIKVSSGDISYPKPDIRFWILLVAGIWLFYVVIHKIIRKLFALDLPSTTMWAKMDDQLLTDNKLNSLLLIIGPPGSGKLRRIKQKLIKNRLLKAENDELDALEADDNFDEMMRRLKEFGAKRLLGNHDEILVFYDDEECPDEEKKAQSNVLIADMMKIPAGAGQDDTDWKLLKKDSLKDSIALVIINHFEYNIKDPKTNSLKLDFLESLMLKGKAKIIIISTVHPLTFLNSFYEKPINLNTADKKTTDPVATDVPNVIDESELERWHVVLGHYRIVIEPLERDEPKDPDMLKQAIKRETEYSHFLHNMQGATIKDIKPNNTAEEIGPASDSIIFKVQIVSHYFYTYIWQSLTKEEKFLLYDLAEDGLVNPYDDYNLCMLISKGLIIKNNGTLMLFNKGFRNFILTAIGETEVNRIKEQVKDNGYWNSLKIPLNLTILAILVFLFTSQQEAYSHIITYITAFSAGIPAVIKVFSLFGNSTQKTQ